MRLKLFMRTLFCHDIDEICWPQPIKLPKSGDVTGQGSMYPMFWKEIFSEIVDVVKLLFKRFHY